MTNDKELIKRLAEEVGCGSIPKSNGVFVPAPNLDKLIARYLAERGGEAVAWHTDDHLTDKSATTYDRDVAERWKVKGWPVTPHFLAPQPAIPEGMVLFGRTTDGNTILPPASVDDGIKLYAKVKP